MNVEVSLLVSLNRPVWALHFLVSSQNEGSAGCVQSSLVHTGLCVHCEQRAEADRSGQHRLAPPALRVCAAPARRLACFRVDFTVGSARGIVTYFGFASAAFPPEEDAVWHHQDRIVETRWLQTNRNELEPEDFSIHTD